MIRAGDIFSERENLNAISTAVIAVFTVSLWYSTHRLWRAGEAQRALSERVAAEQAYYTKESLRIASESAVAANDSARAAEGQVQISRDSMINLQRAFVGLDKIVAEPKEQNGGYVTSWALTCVWRNYGQTPAIRVNNTIGLTNLVQYAPLSPDFEFPVVGIDHWETFIINPGAKSAMSENIPTKRLQGYGERPLVYVYGWVEYNDIFIGTARHRTEFCAEVMIYGDPLSETCEFSFLRTGGFNGMDSDCRHQPPDQPRPMQVS